MALELEVASAELGDKRLNKRLSLILERSETHPNLSIPAAMHGRAEMEAAYRFFANENVTPEKIHAPHYAMTKELSRNKFPILGGVGDGGVIPLWEVFVELDGKRVLEVAGVFSAC